MSDPKRATLITVGAPKSAKSNVNKTVRLTVHLEESTNCKYPELNYKELVIAEEKKKHVQNGKTTGLDPFLDNDDDVERVARKFEQKYGGKSTYGKKGRTKQDDFADIGAGYDENDSFIDNTHGYDEMIPPECDTLHGGFYINSGSLEFKNVPLEQSSNSDEIAGKRNKRRISSSSSEESSGSSSESSQDENNQKTVNGTGDNHDERRKKKKKKSDKSKAKKVRRTDSSAATSGKQTSDDNVQDGESADGADSRTSRSDSAASKRTPTSEAVVTSDSSRDADAKSDTKLSEGVVQVLMTLEAAVGAQAAAPPNQPLAAHETNLLRLEEAIRASGGDACAARAAWARAAKTLGTTRARLLQRVRAARRPPTVPEAASSDADRPGKGSQDHVTADYAVLSPERREELIVETLQRLKDLIEERKPLMLANYTAECKRVLEVRKKLKQAQEAEGAPHTEKRLPKRRFPWCGRSRALLARLAALAGSQAAAAALLARRALPLFPSGFARMPTLLRQADLSKEIKASDLKRQPVGVAPQTVAPMPTHPQPAGLTESIQFPSSLTVTTMLKSSPEKPEPMETDDKYNPSAFGTILNSFSVKGLSEEKDKKEDKPEDLYIPPNNIGSITITAVPNQKEKKIDKPSGLIRVKSPASLNDMVNKKDSKPIKKQEKPTNTKRVESPLHIDTSYQPSKKDPSPKHSDSSQSKKEPSPKHLDGSQSKKDPSPKSKDELIKKQIESMRVAENNIPRPALVPVHHSPTFAKPDKRPPEVKKKKDLIVISDVDPLSDCSEPLNFDDSSSDVEVIETDKSDSLVPSKDKKKSVKSVPKLRDGKDDQAEDDIDTLLRNIREMERRTNSSEQNGWS